MKPLKLLFLISVVILYSCGSKLPVPADKKATKETVNLFKSLFELQNRGVMYGHQDDLMYGRSLFLKDIQEPNIYTRK